MLSIFIGFLAAVTGLLISRYISKKVRAKSPLMCPRSAPCEEVVNSRHGRTLGISNARLGQLYYVVVGVLFLAVMDGISFPLQWPLMIGVTVVGFLFSLYLVCIQAFVLRKWCLWCLGSTLCATVVFFCAILLFHH